MQPQTFNEKTTWTPRKEIFKWNTNYRSHLWKFSRKPKRTYSTKHMSPYPSSAATSRKWTPMWISICIKFIEKHLRRKNGWNIRTGALKKHDNDMMKMFKKSTFNWNVQHVCLRKLWCALCWLQHRKLTWDQLHGAVCPPNYKPHLRTRLTSNAKMKSIHKLVEYRD